MDKNRDGDRGDKSRGGGHPQRLDIASAVDALYAPWLQQEQTLLSNMFSGSGHSAYQAAAAAAAMNSLGYPPGYPQVSSSAGLASLAAAQQAQQAQAAAALASLGPSAAWWNLAGLQQMELLSRLQGGLGGYPSIHPEHLMNLELLQAQQAAMAAALSTNSKAAAPASRTSSNGSTSSSGSTSLKNSSRNLGGSTPGPSSRVNSSSRNPHRRDHARHDNSRLSLENNRLDARPTSSSSSHHSSPLSSLESAISVRSDLGAGSGALSYGIASLMADKMPSSHKGSSSAGSSRNNASEYGGSHRLSNNSGPTSLSKAMRSSKELEIIPISSSTGSSSSKESSLAAQLGARGLLRPTSSSTSDSLSSSSSRVPIMAHQESSSKGLHSDSGSGSLKAPPIPSFSHGSDSKVSISSLTNGIPNLGSAHNWREESANVSIEPCGGSGGDTPLNLSLKSGSSKSERSEKREMKAPSPSHADLLNRLKSPINPFDYTQSLGLGMGLMPTEMEVLQSLYGHHGESRDVLASMQEALQRQLLVADTKKREEKKKRVRSSTSMEDAQERARHLGRGVSKPKKNTVASLLEHCRAVGIKPQIPLPTTSLSSTSVTTSPPLSLTTSSSSPATHSSSAAISSLSSSTAQSLPPSLIPLFPSSLHSSSSHLSSTGSLMPPIPSVSISPFPVVSSPSCSSSSSLPLTLPASLSISSCPLVSSATESTQMSPSVTLQPASLTSRGAKEALSMLENKVQITPISSQDTSDMSKKRHMIATSCVDGRLLTTIKTSSTHSELSEMSDFDSDDDSSSVSSFDDESGGGSLNSSWLKRDASEMSSTYSGSPPTKKRKMITDEGSLRVPLLFGWRRETTMRGITQSGVRGEVVYYAPCGKPFKQYPDIIRYLERQNINEVTRDHFSFSSKITVGEYVDCNTQQRYTESEIRDIVREIRAKKGLKMQHQSKNKEAKRTTPPLSTSAKLAALQAKEGRDLLELEAEAVLRRLEEEEQAAKSRQDVVSKIEEQRQLRVWKEQEKIKKQEEIRKEKEEQRKQREEVNRQRLYEQLKKAQEREQEKQKQKLLKEQLYLQELTKQREMLYTLELERERRRYHGILVRTLEARKRYEEREKRRECVKEEKRVYKEKKREERLAARELTLLLKESKEDMELTDHIPLPDVPLVAGIRLPPESFGNVLMIFEFLHNFGETLGFDMDSLPSLHSLQLALLHDSESEEEILNVLCHLLVCAIEDPGIPNSQRNTTILGQTLNRADITPNNISEILRVYFHANATGEVRTVYNLHGTEKERRENPSKSQEFDARLNENEAYKMSLWLQKVPFLSLNPVQKSEIVGYVCNELLQNKAVLKQIEESLDRHNGLKTEKWKLDARIRKLRMSVARKRIYNTAMRGMVDTHRDDSNLSNISGLSSSLWDLEKEKKEIERIKDEEDADKMKDDDDLDEDDEHDNESGNESEPMEEVHVEEEEDKHMNADEAAKTLDVLQQQMDQVRQELFETAQQVRGFVGGQDRYQRTFWALPHAGGPFLEGLSTCDYVGRSHFPTVIPPAQPQEGLTYEELCKLKKEFEDKSVIKDIIINGDNKEKIKMEIDKDIKKEVPTTQVKAESLFESDLNKDSKMEIDVKEIKKEEKVKMDVDLVNGQIDEDHQNNNDGDEMETKSVNGTPVKCELLKIKTTENDHHMSEETMDPKSEIEDKDSSAILNCSSNSVKEFSIPTSVITATTTAVSTSTTSSADVVDKDLVATGLGLIPGQYLRPEHVAQYEKLSFSLLPRIPCDPLTVTNVPNHTTPIGTPKVGGSTSGGESDSALPNSPFVNSNGSTPLTSLTPILQNSLVSNSMSHKELLEKLHQTAEAVPIPNEYKNGWWNFPDLDLLKKMVESLNERGARERDLKRFLERNFNIVKNALAKQSDKNRLVFDSIDNDAVSLEAINYEEEPVLYDRFGVPVSDEPCHWSPEIALRVDQLSLEAVYAMEEKITNASMQNKNWRVGENMERPHYEFRPSCLDPVDENDKRTNPIHVGRDLLLSLEEGIERRYLKPPLGVVPAPKNENGTECSKVISDHPKGLGTWREAVVKCETASQLAMCTYQLETAVAWDKSIMKAYCQFCHSGDFEEKLLLCDGCDKGYHTHCFKPPMNNIPEGDWYCFECVNKFSESAQRHCLVCGGTEGRNVVHCASCPRAYHSTCITPPLNKIPRNKWNCPACSSKSPRGRRGRTKKPSESNPPSTPTVATPNTPSSLSATPCTQSTTNSVNITSPPATPIHPVVANNCSPPPTPTTEPVNHTSLPSPFMANQISPSFNSPQSMEVEEEMCGGVTEPLQGTLYSPVSLGTGTITTNSTTTPTTPNGGPLNNHQNSNSNSQNNGPNSSTPKKEKTLKKKDFRELATCKMIQYDLENHEDAWPFLLPVNTRQFPTYKKIIKKPIDLSTIRKRLEDIVYKCKEDYSDDLRLMFNNCETFNEDDSPVGKAGHNLRSFFEAKWNENFIPS